MSDNENNGDDEEVTGFLHNKRWIYSGEQPQIMGFVWWLWASLLLISLFPKVIIPMWIAATIARGLTLYMNTRLSVVFIDIPRNFLGRMLHDGVVTLNKKNLKKVLENRK